MPPLREQPPRPHAPRVSSPRGHSGGFHSFCLSGPICSDCAHSPRWGCRAVDGLESAGQGAGRLRGPHGPLPGSCLLPPGSLVPLKQVGSVSVVTDVQKYLGSLFTGVRGAPSPGI